MKKYLVNVVTNKGKIRQKNEDNFYCNGTYRELNTEQNQSYEFIFGDNNLVFAVFDGMGGLNYGEEASYLATKALHKIITSTKENHAFDGVDAINCLNKSICQKNEMLSKKSGSTAVILTCDLSVGQFFNIGDSRAYLFRNNKLEQLSVDHTEENSWEQFYKETGINIKSKNKNSKHMLTQHLGIEEENFIIEPHVTEKFNLYSDDILLLCSDGLTNMLSDEQITDILSQNIDLSKKSEQLLSYSLQAGGNDNITFILIEVKT